MEPRGGTGDAVVCVCLPGLVSVSGEESESESAGNCGGGSPKLHQTLKGDVNNDGMGMRRSRGQRVCPLLSSYEVTQMNASTETKTLIENQALFFFVSAHSLASAVEIIGENSYCMLRESLTIEEEEEKKEKSLTSENLCSVCACMYTQRKLYLIKALVSLGVFHDLTIYSKMSDESLSDFTSVSAGGLFARALCESIHAPP